MTKYIILFFIAFNTFGQVEKEQLNDSIKFERKLFKNSFIVNGKKISRKETYKFIYDNKEVKKIFKRSSQLVPVSVLSTAGGLYLTISGIRGIDASQTINNEVKNYQVRSFPKTIVGLGLLTGAICLFEYSNDLLNTSINLHNGKRGQLSLNTNGVGFTLRF